MTCSRGTPQQEAGDMVQYTVPFPFNEIKRHGDMNTPLIGAFSNVSLGVS